MSIRRPSLAGQFLLILSGTILISQLVVNSVFFGIAGSRASEHEEYVIIGSISSVFKNIDNKQSEEQEEILGLLDSSEVFFYISRVNEASIPLRDDEKISWFNSHLGDKEIYFSDAESTFGDAWVFWFDDDWETCFMLARSVESTKSCPHQVFSIQLSNGNWLNAKIDVEPGALVAILPMLISVSISLCCLFFATLIAIKQVTRPLEKLASTAERFGRGENVAFDETKGPRELVSLGRTLSTMQSRLTRFIQDRTRMLAAISHDLRTPITSLRLRSEFVEDPVLQKKMVSTLEEMESMIESTLDFAKQEYFQEEIGTIDIPEVLSELVEETRNITLSSDVESYLYPCQPVSFKRAIRNLIVNANQHAESATVRFTCDEDNCRIFVEDNGPGIPEEKLAQVFEPFFRLDESRNTSNGSVGLGLSITRTIIHKHGGSILARNTDKGLTVEISLPK